MPASGFHLLANATEGRKRFRIRFFTTHRLPLHEVLSPGPSENLDRLVAVSPWLVDDAWGKGNLACGRGP